MKITDENNATTETHPFRIFPNYIPVISDLGGSPTNHETLKAYRNVEWVRSFTITDGNYNYPNDID